jgi:hypothetical protein
MKCRIHDEREPGGVCSCSDIVKALRLSDADVEKLREIRKAVHHTAYSKIGLDGAHLDLLDRILVANGGSHD